MALQWANVKYIFDTGAGDILVGCFFLQEQKDKFLKASCNWSRSLCDAEQRRDTMNKENLVFVLNFLKLVPSHKGSFFCSSEWLSSFTLDIAM